MLYEEVYIMTFQKVEKGLEIPPNRKRMGLVAGRRSVVGLVRRACSEQGCWCARTAHVGDTGSSHQSDDAGSGDQICDYL